MHDKTGKLLDLTLPLLKVFTFTSNMSVEVEFNHDKSPVIRLNDINCDAVSVTIIEFSFRIKERRYAATIGEDVKVTIDGASKLANVLRLMSNVYNGA